MWRIALKGKVITIQDVFAKIKERMDTNIEEVKKALDWTEVAELKRKNARIATHEKLWK